MKKVYESFDREVNKALEEGTDPNIVYSLAYDVICKHETKLLENIADSKERLNLVNIELERLKSIDSDVKLDIFLILKRMEELHTDAFSLSSLLCDRL